MTAKALFEKLLKTITRMTRTIQFVRDQYLRSKDATNWKSFIINSWSLWNIHSFRIPCSMHDAHVSEGRTSRPGRWFIVDCVFFVLRCFITGIGIAVVVPFCICWGKFIVSSQLSNNTSTIPSEVSSMKKASWFVIRCISTIRPESKAKSVSIFRWILGVVIDLVCLVYWDE